MMDDQEALELVGKALERIVGKVDNPEELRAAGRSPEREFTFSGLPGCR